MRWAHLGWVAVMAAILAGRSNRTGTELAAANTAPQDRPECPHSWTPQKYMTTPPSLSGPITDIPEYHDCQRFIVDGPGGRPVYDSLFAIYARYRMQDAFPGDTSDPQFVPADTTPVALATIAGYNGGYPQLGIRAGVNCLYLARTRAPSRFRAFVYWNGVDGDCPVKLPAAGTLPPTELEVRAIPWGTKSSPPQVARWDWDSRNREQHIGIWCPLHWCDIGRRGFQPDPAVRLPADAPEPLRRVARYKGYYDRQLLAVPSQPTTPNGIAVRPSDMMGYVFPHPDIASRSQADYRTGWRLLGRLGSWVQAKTVAYYLVDREHYREKGPLKLGRGLSSLEMRLASPVPVKYQLRLRGPAGTTGDLQVIRRSMVTTSQQYPIPPTTRWRWRPDDETTWFACVLACCEVEEL